MFIRSQRNARTTTDFQQKKRSRVEVYRRWMLELKKRGISPKFALVDKDFGEISAIQLVWDHEARPQLCLWHAKKAIDVRLLGGKNKKKTVYYPLDAKEIIPSLDLNFLPAHHSARNGSRSGLTIAGQAISNPLSTSLHNTSTQSHPSPTTVQLSSAPPATNPPRISSTVDESSQRITLRIQHLGPNAPSYSAAFKSQLETSERNITKELLGENGIVEGDLLEDLEEVQQWKPATASSKRKRKPDSESRVSSWFNLDN
jgi:hypothetical protein